MEYFTLSWTQHDNGQIINSGSCIYYTSGGKNLDEMKGFIRTNIVHDPFAVIMLPLITPLTEEEYNFEADKIKARQNSN